MRIKELTWLTAALNFVQLFAFKLEWVKKKGRKYKGKTGIKIMLYFTFLSNEFFPTLTVIVSNKKSENGFLSHRELKWFDTKVVENWIVRIVLLTIIKSIPGITIRSLSPVIVSYHNSPGIINDRRKRAPLYRINFLSFPLLPRSLLNKLISRG